MLATLEQLLSAQVMAGQLVAPNQLCLWLSVWLHCMSVSLTCPFISCEGHGTHQPSIAGMVEKRMLH